MEGVLFAPLQKSHLLAGCEDSTQRRRDSQRPAEASFSLRFSAFLCCAIPRNRAFRARSWAKQFNRRDAKDAARQSRNRTARSVWSARSLLPLSNHLHRTNSASKLDALQTLRVALHPQIFAGCEQFRLLQCREKTPVGNLCVHRASAVFLALGIGCGSVALRLCLLASLR